MLKLFIAAALAAAAAPALADTAVPPANYYVHFEGQGQQDANVGSYSSGASTVVFGLDPSPSLRVTATSGLGSTTAGMNYFFRIEGPDAGFIPIQAQGLITVVSSGPDDGQANAFAQLGLTTAFNSPTAFMESDSGGFNNGGAGTTTPLLQAYTMAGYNVAVHLIAGFNGGNGRHGIATGMAFVDPIISIDPAFAAIDPDYLKHYTIVFSEGAGNSLASEGGGSMGGVPEPATWALMLTGFGLTGAALRRRKFAAA